MSLHIYPILMLSLLLVSMVHADVILEGHHSVNHRIYIDNLANFQDYEFVIYSVTPSGDESITQINSIGEVPNAYKFSITKIYAIPKDSMAAVLESKKPSSDSLQVSWGTCSARISDLPDTDSRTKIESHCMLESEAGSFILSEKQSASYCNCQSCQVTDPMVITRYAWVLVPTLGLGLLCGYVAAGYLTRRKT